jgi:integrase
LRAPEAKVTAAMSKRKPPTTVRAKGVELRAHSYRFSDRTGGRRHYVNYPFLPESSCRKANLPLNDPRWPANALADANEYSRTYHRDANLPRIQERQPIAGTLRAWLERYRDEALIGHRYGDPQLPAPFAREVSSEAGRKHDIGQINTLLRMGGFTIAGEAEHRAKNPRAAKMLDRHRPAFSPEVRNVLDTEIVSLGKSHFRVILDRWSAGKAAAPTKRRLRTTLSQSFEYHASNYDMNPGTEWLRIPIVGDGSEPKARALTEAEWTAIKNRLDTMNLHPSVRAAILFIRWTGVRRGEACSLRWEHISWPASRNAVPVALLKRTKAKRGTYKERHVPIPPNAQDALRALINGEDKKTPIWPKSGWVFPSPSKKGEHVPGQTIWQAFVRVFGAQQRKGAATKPSGIAVKRAAPHHLRHTRATELSVTMGEQQMMELFGWSDSEMLGRYRHIAENMGLLVRDADNRLRSTAELKRTDDVMEFFQNLSKTDRESLMTSMAVMVAREGLPASSSSGKKSSTKRR